MDFDTIMRKAEARMNELSAIERATGYTSPANCPPEVELRTVEAALECAIQTNDWDCVAEGLVMLKDATRKVT